ncbi:zinc ribbon domain-containing protein [Coprobacter fastidiosus]|uniref:Double zinc ribbon protein n=1 Tax=Coprobacter fastidiosus NSB1 = JCM 33896 TaxID=1349822 RepID=A0A495VNE9_9BACT|nr:zinc ribbon domain-containing protein [Coprobacter fastidiosus]RKT49855.1 double zinc ribbon protein [Coprobacter fastidiosus NSB1 = JCM 33896]
MNCQFCGQELPENAKFCFKCRRQIICMNCGERLIEGASICVFCGNEISIPNNNIEQNHIKYKETKTLKSFEATFSNETAGAVAKTFAQFLPLKKNIIGDTKEIFHDTQIEDVEDITPAKALLPVKQEELADKNPNINDIFKVRGDNDIYLHETSLKANSKVDYAGRLTILYLFYMQSNGTTEVPKTEVIAFLKKIGFNNDGNYRGWMSKMKALYNINNNCYCLCRAGEERAKEYLKDIFDGDKVDNWKLGDTSKGNYRSNNKANNIPKNSYSIEGSLNLNPSDNESLKSFIGKFKASNGFQYNLLFAYYLQKVIGKTNINANHIYTCYKNVGVKIPNNLYQSLVDTKNKKGWIDTSDMNNITVTISGENCVEQDLKK